MAENFISVIIPTYNRKKILVKCLKALFNQDYPKSLYEIIIIDDGSVDSTKTEVKKLYQFSPVSLIYLKQSNKGPAAARNYGIARAKGKIILIMGDDIIATPHLLKEHDKIHQLYPMENIAVIGYVTWSPDIKITPFMYWLENGGPQFRYYKLTPNTFTDYKYFYTSNISLKKILFNKEQFNELFPYAAYEDIELGYRLHQRGLKIFYNPKAKAFHWHKINLKSYTKRNFQVGISRAIFNKLHPRLTKNPIRSFKSRFVYNSLTIWFWMLIGKFYEKRKIKHRLFHEICQYFYIKGFKSKMKDKR